MEEVGRDGRDRHDRLVEALLEAHRGFVAPLTLRTYWRAAASISSAVAGGWRPRSTVMLRHMAVLLVA